MIHNQLILTTRIGKRLLKFVALSTLIPVILLGLVSAQYFISHFKEVSREEIQRSQQNVSALIHERILFLNQKFQHTTQNIDNLNELPHAEAQANIALLKKWFSAVGKLSSNGAYKSIYGSISAQDIQDLFKNSQNHQYRPGLKILKTKKDAARLLLYQAIIVNNVNKGFLVAEINPDYLFSFALNNEQTSLCIINTQDVRLFCPPGLFAKVQEEIQQANSLYGSVDALAETLPGYALWTASAISLRPLIETQNWRIYVGQRSGVVWQTLSQFFIYFAIVLVFAMVLISVLSFAHIRHYVTPLNRLRQGIRDLANQNLHTEVKITSGDEFEDLASSFNDMSIRVSKQFDAMDMMSRIDRLILSTLDIDNIIETILVRMIRIVPCDTVSVLLIDDNTEHNAKLFYRGDNLSTKIQSANVLLKPRDLNLFRENRESILIENNGFSPHYLEPIKKQHTAFLLLPIFLAEKLNAAIILGYYEQPSYTAEDLIHARDLAHRVAVALSNAAWEDKLYHKAHYDALTNLPNRLLFHERLDHAITRANRDKSYVGLMFIDLDRFKFINDSLGHDVGDEFLVQTAIRLKNSVRGVDTVSRLGGDEFTIILPDFKNPDQITTDLANIASKILENIATPYMLNNQEVNSSASIGVAIYPKDASDHAEFVKSADSAMYYAKACGKSNYQFYSEDLNKEAKSKLILENQLHHALDRNEFLLYYQPRINLKSNTICSVEALIRWDHAENGIISPENFIYIAEENGLINKIGEWILYTACKQLKQWHQSGYSDLRVSINLSAYQFQAENLITLIKSVLMRTNLDAKYLEIEITEGTLMQDNNHAIETLKALKSMGVSLAIDDFGTGYSSLSYLKRFPLDSIKIDQSFVCNIAEDKDNLAIVTAIIHLGKSLNLNVVAEGAEKEAEVNILKELNCDEIQGFYFSCPLSANDTLEFLQTYPKQAD